jgi:hypothetical protein
MTSLYQLQTNYQILLHKEELTADDLKLIEELPDLIEDKLINIAYVIKNMDYLIDNIDNELKKMTERKRRLQNNRDNLQSSILNNMIVNDIKKIDKCPHFEIAIHKKRQAVEIYDKEKIDKKYLEMEVIMKIQKDKIREDLEKGEIIEGAKLIDPFRLSIK